MSYSKELYHYSRSREIILEDSYYDKWREYHKQTGDSFKPYGFWLSVEDEGSHNWKDWCIAESFKLENLQYKFLVDIQPDANILHLSTEKELIDFSVTYALNDPEEFRIFSKNFLGEPYVYRINWARLRELYDGIIISPYQWNLRMNQTTTWYYPWDCASGCIWNIKVIKGLNLVEENTECRDIPCKIHIDKQELIKIINEKFKFSKDGVATHR